MTLMPSRHVRDPRRRYLANKIRKGQPREVPPIVVDPVLVQELVNASTKVRMHVLQRIESAQGSEYATAVVAAVAALLRETRKQ